MLLELSITIKYIYIFINIFKLYRIRYLQSGLFDEFQHGIMY